MQARVKCTLCQMSDTEISSKIPAVQDAVVKGGELTKYLFDSTEPQTNSCLEHCGKKFKTTKGATWPVAANHRHLYKLCT